MEAQALILIPRMSEKSYALSKQHTYVFEVPISANKAAVIAAVAVQYGVGVTDARILITKGKYKQSVRKGRRPVQGKRTDVKKAYVTLAEGSSIEIFEEEEQ